MSQNYEALRQWAKALEAGKRNEPLLELAARLQTLAAKTTPPRPPAELKEQLRQQLLASYQSRLSIRLWRGVGSAAALGVLAVVAAAAWFIISNSINPIAGDQPTPPPAEAIPPSPEFAPSQHLGARLGEAIELVGYDLADNTVQPGEEVSLTLYWQTIALPTVDATLFLHLYDEDGLLVSQFDGPLLDGARPTSSWRPGEMISNTVSLLLPSENLAPGDYRLEMGLYLLETGERLVITQPDAQSTELVLGSIIVEPTETVQPNGLDHLTVLSVTPESGQVFSSTAPITFEIRLDYELASLPEAIIKAAVVQQFGNGGGGRGVANAQVTVQQGSGEVLLTAVLYPQRELNGPANLGLLVQMHHAERSAAIAMDIPDTYHWRYEP
jgi:hypothetical protein